MLTLMKGLPYSWSQTLGDVTVSFAVPKGARGRDCDVKIQRRKLTAGLKGKEPIISVRLLLLKSFC